MPSSFLVAYPDLPVSALVYTPSLSADADYAVENLFEGEKSCHYRINTTGTNYTLDFDMGVTGSRTVDHLIVGNAQYLKANSVTNVLVYASTDNATWIAQLGTNVFQSQTLFGPRARDFISTPTFQNNYLTTPGTYRYWRFAVSGLSAINFTMSKLFCGTFWDAGKEPDYFEWEAVGQDAETWRYPRGHLRMDRAGEVRHRVTVEWDGLTDVVAKNFTDNVLANRIQRPVYLWTGTYTDPLFDKRLLYCRVTDETAVTQVKQDYNSVSAVFEEVVP